MRGDICCEEPTDVFFLGHPAIESLGLVSRVNTVEDLKLRHMSKYPYLFKGLGKTPGEYHIHLKDDAKPFALSTPRRVALPLQPKVKKELQRMEQLGVISRVDDPSDWCAGMVVVPSQMARFAFAWTSQS